MSPEATQSDNPLLFEGGLPPFDAIEAEHVVPAMRVVLAELATALEKAEREAAPTWESAVECVQAIGERLGRPWGAVGHLLGVRNREELRAAHEEIQPAVVEFSLAIGQSRPLYDALKGLREGPDFARLDETQRRIVDTMLRDARHSGVGLEGEDR